ncbi:MAG TPA: hypothetical protein PKA32_00075 [Candidatus Gracilibacteria bacterium]|nr:hypothetical protein [Candidatus Gracilibacteria bacterium]
MKRWFAVIAMSLFVLAGCQAQEPTDMQQSQQEDSEKTVLPTPSIKGPSELPNMKGPDGPPPTSESVNGDSPQSMTETETVEYSLPESDAEFKIR